MEASIQLLAGDLAGLKPEEASKYAVQVGDFDIQSASEWPGLDEERLLLSPSKCRQLWRQFSSDSNYIVQQAQATQVNPPNQYTFYAGHYHSSAMSSCVNCSNSPSHTTSPAHVLSSRC